MKIKDFFEEVGGNYEEIIGRIPSESILEKFVKQFPGDKSFEALEKAFEEENVKEAFLASHTLKGVADNLGMGKLAETASELTEKLRNATFLPEEKSFFEVKKAYELTVKKISELD